MLNLPAGNIDQTMSVIIIDQVDESIKVPLNIECSCMPPYVYIVHFFALGPSMAPWLLGLQVFPSPATKASITKLTVRPVGEALEGRLQDAAQYCMHSILWSRRTLRTVLRRTAGLRSTHPQATAPLSPFPFGLCPLPLLTPIIQPSFHYSVPLLSAHPYGGTLLPTLAPYCTHLTTLAPIPLYFTGKLVPTQSRRACFFLSQNFRGS